MMYGIILISMGVIVIGVILYSCTTISTTYDKKINDLAQEQFLKQHKKSRHMK